MVSVMKTGKILTVKNPVIDSDFPDPDIIRVVYGEYDNAFYAGVCNFTFIRSCKMGNSFTCV